MGCCLSVRIKSENPSLKAANLTRDGKEDDGSISGSNTVSQLKMFTYNELKTATRNFRSNNRVDEGGFGFVFRGRLDEQTLAPAKPGTGIAIAVKKLNPDGFHHQGHKEWLAEIEFLGRLHHPNIVKLIGFCSEDVQRFLVYEFLTKGSLDHYLFLSSTYVEPLSWRNRMKIALGVAKVLAFHHSDEVNVIYRDLKASNILLDSSFNAKLFDFSLARDGPSGDESHVSTRVMGTYGYAAPEHIATGHLSKKSDVYSFGIVLHEIMSSKRVLDANRPARERNLVEWAKPYLLSKHRFFKVIDARIEGQYSAREAMKVAKIAVQCVSAEPQLRPTMADVVRSLEELHDSSDPGSSKQ